MATRTKLIDQLTDAEIIALYTCIAGWGERSWRSKLRLVWEGERPYPVSWNPDSAAALQRLRNRMGSYVLCRLKTDQILAAHQELVNNARLAAVVELNRNFDHACKNTLVIK